MRFFYIGAGAALVFTQSLGLKKIDATPPATLSLTLELLKVAWTDTYSLSAGTKTVWLLLHLLSLILLQKQPGFSHH
jgi:hypothetical protein